MQSRKNKESLDQIDQEEIVEEALETQEDQLLLHN